MGILKQKVLYSVKKAWLFDLQARSYRIQNNLFARSERSERSAYVFLTWFEIASWSCVSRVLVGSIFSEKAETVQNTAD